MGEQNVNINDYDEKDEKDDGVSALAPIAMQVILAAGEAKVASEQALKKLHDFSFDEAEALMEKAQEHLVEAHNAQTNVIQSEAEGKRYENSFLFNHAQDSLMNSMTQCNLTKEIIALYKLLYQEITKEK